MNLLPFENIEIESPLTKSEVEDVIRDNIAWTTDLGMSYSENPLREYEGFIKNGTFKIKRILKFGRNAFIPIVTGTISESEGKSSRITSQLRLSKAVMIFTIVVTLFSCILPITSLFSSNHSITKESQRELLITHSINEELAEGLVNNMEVIAEPARIDWFSFFHFIIPFLMITIFFNYEAALVKNKLNSILKG